METKSVKYKIRLGLFVVIGFALFVLAIFWIGRQQNLFNPTFTLRTKFNDVSGLQAGNNVRFSGITVGTVDAIQIMSDTSVLVLLKVQNDVRRFIKQDAFVTIGSEGFIGDKVLVISQGTPDSPPVTEGFLMASQNPVNMDAMLTSLSSTAENANVITGELAEIMYKLNNGEGAIGRLLSDSSIAVNMERTMKNIESGTRGFSQNMEAAKNSVLLRGYFKKKEKEAEEAKKERQRAENQNQKKQSKKSNGLLKGIFKNNSDTVPSSDTTKTPKP